MHLVGFWEQSINISEGCFNKGLFAQKLLIPSLVVAMVKHVDLNRNNEHRLERSTPPVCVYVSS